jgi:hypothetical protein
VADSNISDWTVASAARNTFTSHVAATSFAIDGPGMTVVWTSEENNEFTCAVGAIYPRPTLAADAALPTLMLVKFCESPGRCGSPETLRCQGRPGSGVRLLSIPDGSTAQR